MLIHDFTKHSTEKITKEIDYTDRLPTGVLLSTVSAAAISLMNGAAASILGTVTISGDEILVPFQGGADGSDYLMTNQSTLSDGSVFTDSILVRVRDRQL